MRSFFTSLLLFIAISVSSQEIPSKIKLALKNDNSRALKKELTKENINKCYETGNSSYSLLILSIKTNSKECFNLLIKKKANLNKDCSGKTPLIYTAQNGRIEMAKRLIKKGADSKIKYKGRTALMYAKKYKEIALIEYLERL